MGDRCYLEITIRKKDIPKWNNVWETGKDPNDFLSWLDGHDEKEDGTIEGYSHEANYAWDSELQQAAEFGCVFYGSHSAGGEYGEGVFCSCGVKLLSSPTHENEFVVAVRPDKKGKLKMSTSEMKAVQAYYDAEVLATLLTHGKPTPEPKRSNHG